MGKKIIYMILAASVGLNAGLILVTVMNSDRHDSPHQVPARPGGPRPDPAHMIDNHVRGITKHLGLSPEQQEQIRTVLEQHVPQLILAQRKAADMQMKLSDAFGAPDFNDEKFLQLAYETSMARSAVDSISAVMLTGEASVLSHEQRRKFAEVAPTIHSQPPPPRERNHPPRHQ